MFFGRIAKIDFLKSASFVTECSEGVPKEQLFFPAGSTTARNLALVLVLGDKRSPTGAPFSNSGVHSGSESLVLAVCCSSCADMTLRAGAGGRPGGAEKCTRERCKAGMARFGKILWSPKPQHLHQHPPQHPPRAPDPRLPTLGPSAPSRCIQKARCLMLFTFGARPGRENGTGERENVSSLNNKQGTLVARAVC